MIAVLALGIGATTAIFSVVDGVLLRPLPFNEPDRLAAVWIGQPSLASNPVLSWLAEATPVRKAEYQAIRHATPSFAPAFGRTFTLDEDTLGGPNIGVLSWETWRGRYSGDSSIIGRSITLGGAPYTIIGVMPAGFRLDRTVDPPFLSIPALRDSSDLPQQRNRNYQSTGL